MESGLHASSLLGLRLQHLKQGHRPVYNHMECPGAPESLPGRHHHREKAPSLASAPQGCIVLRGAGGAQTKVRCHSLTPSSPGEAPGPGRPPSRQRLPPPTRGWGWDCSRVDLAPQAPLLARSPFESALLGSCISQLSLLVKESTCQRRCKRREFDPWAGKRPWIRTWQPTPAALPGESPWTEEPGGL